MIERDAEIRELRTIEDAVALLDEWAVAHRELQREFLRLSVRCQEAEWWVEQHEFMRRHLDPFLPPAMQDERARAAEPAVYRAIAELLEEQRVKALRRSPFDEPELTASE